MGGWSWFMAGICMQSKSKQLCRGQGNLKQNMTKLTIGRWAVPGSLSLSRFWELLSWPRLANLMLMTKSGIETNPGPCTNPTNDDTLKWFENLQIVNIILHEDQKVCWFVVFGMSFLKPGLVSIECFLEHFFQTLFTWHCFPYVWLVQFAFLSGSSSSLDDIFFFSLFSSFHKCHSCSCCGLLPRTCLHCCFCCLSFLLLRDSASSFHWLSSPIFSCCRSSSRIGNISSHLHYMMFPSIQTIYFLWGYDPGNMSVSTYLLLLSWAQFTVVYLGYKYIFFYLSTLLW